MTRLSLTVAASMIIASSVAQHADAGLLLEYSADGGATFTPICSAASGTSCSNSLITSNGLDFISVGVSSDSPGTSAGASLLTGTVQLTNRTSATQSIELLSGDTGFTGPTPPPPLQLLNSISGTVVFGGAANRFSSQACLDEGNGQNSCPGTFQTPVITADITAPGAGANSDFTNLSSLTEPYSMTELLDISLASGANINFTASSAVAAVPAPLIGHGLWIGLMIGGVLVGQCLFRGIGRAA